jgi:phosphopantothenoylcysteine decarboxylase/phosphopantothenate--cysteine ligase
MGAAVTLISGPSSEKINHPSLKLIKVVSAEEMLTAVQEFYDSTDIAIAAAAVADFKPKKIASNKLKKESGLAHISLVPTVDILSYMGEKKKKQKLIGFALETENELEHAKGKLSRKNLDGIVLNSLQDPDAGFSVTTNKITFIHADFRAESYPLQSKLECAQRIFEQILTL